VSMSLESKSENTYEVTNYLSVFSKAVLVNSHIKYLYVFIITGFVFSTAFLYRLWNLRELKHLGTRI